MSEWKTTPLRNLVELVVDNRGKTPPISENGHELLEVNAISQDRRTPDYSKVRKFVSKDIYEHWFRKGHPKTGDILVPTVGTIGNVALVRENRGAIAQNLIALRLKNDVDSNFVYYYLSSTLGKDMMLSLDIGGVQPSIKVPHLLDMEIQTPFDNDEQKAIASVLSSLDDKIDLLHRQNKTLEAIAETLFRQWFVEEAQEDWEEKPLSSIADFLNGLACQKFPPQNEIDKLPVLKIKELSNGISEASDWATSTVKPQYIVETGDVIFSWSASLIVKVWDGEKCVLNQHLFKVTSEEFPKWFYLMWCKHHLAEFISISSSHATTMGHIKRGDLDTAMVKVPPPDVLVKMTAVMDPLLDKQIENSKQLKGLEKLRDTLLPKLMSGEVRVDYEHQDH